MEFYQGQNLRQSIQYREFLGIFLRGYILIYFYIFQAYNYLFIILSFSA